MKVQLDRIQKIAFSRIITDLIEADFFVGENELSFFDQIISKEDLCISESMLVEAKKMDLAKAVTILKELNLEKRKKLVDYLKVISLSDGTCQPREAILIFALEQAIEYDAYIYSVPSVNIEIDNQEVIYIENKKDTEISRMIESNYRTINNEFALAGFDFVYIPFIVNDFKKLDSDFLKKVVRYMIPSVSPDKVDTICNNLQNMTTSQFCRDLLYKKINIPLLDVKPSLLFKLNDSSIIEQFDLNDAERISYANFLRIELKEDMLCEIHHIIDSYHRLMNCPITVRSIPKKQRFPYYGFHRSLFDLIAYGKEQKEYNLFFDLTKHKAQIYFEPTDGSGERIPIKLNPQETALYVMIVKKSFSGFGLDWREQIPNKQKKELLLEYNKIYSYIGKGNTTMEYKDRTQVHHIKNRIRAIQCVANMELFIPMHIKDGLYSYYMVKATAHDIHIQE